MNGNNACPSCGRSCNEASSFSGQAPARPSVGDVSICLYCGEFAIFTGDGLGKRGPTEDELRQIQADPHARRARSVLALFNMAYAARWENP